MILALAKRLPAFRRRSAAGAWRLAGDKVRDIAGLRLGLLGCGAIGQAVARLAAAFGMEVAAYDPVGASPAGIDADARPARAAGPLATCSRCICPTARRHGT